MSLNKPLKDRLRATYEEWFSATMKSLKGTTKSGMIRAPTKEDLRQWVEDAICSLEKGSIMKAFKCCGINLAQDHSEDYLLSEKLRSDKSISETAREVEKFYEESEAFDQPYEDFPSLLNEMRENENVIYDLQKVTYFLCLPVLTLPQETEIEGTILASKLPVLDEASSDCDQESVEALVE